MTTAAAIDLSELEQDPRLFLYTSLTAGSSHIITATSRMETILKANKIPFLAIDTATDEKARRLWQRRAGKRKLPGLVKEGYVLGDLDEIEEWNEFGELKENIGPVPDAKAPVSKQSTTSASSSASKSVPTQETTQSQRIALPGAAEIAARNKPATPTSNPASASTEAKPDTSTSTAPNEKLKNLKIADTLAGEDHLSAPPSGVATPANEPAKTAAAPALKNIQNLQQEEHPNLDHLSAPASRLHSETASPAPEMADEEKKPEAPRLEHRGSEIKEAPQDVVKQIEKRNSIPEETEEEEEKQEKAKDAGEGKKTQEQSAKEPDDAGESVGD